MSPVSFIQDYIEKKQIEKMLSTQEWSLDFYSNQAPHADCFIYVIDLLDTGRLVLTSSRRQDIDKLNEAPFSMDDRASAVSNCLFHYGKDAGLSEAMGLAAAMYLSGTRTWTMAKNQIPEGHAIHAILIRYGAPGKTDGKLRPVALPGESKPLHPEMVLAAAYNAYEYDKANNPQHLPKGDVVPIRPRYQ